MRRRQHLHKMDELLFVLSITKDLPYLTFQYKERHKLKYSHGLLLTIVYR